MERSGCPCGRNGPDLVLGGYVGFKLPIRTARLVFDGDYQGLEVKVRLNIPLKTYLAIQDLLA